MTANVLLVEDDPDQAMLFAQVLELSGYTVTAVLSAEEGQARLTAGSFALLLADWDLPGGMNGDALIAWAKVHVPGTRTVLFSNHTEVDEIAKDCGADAAFRKTDGIAKLRQLVNTLAPADADQA